jgi:hypothetical protein
MSLPRRRTVEAPGRKAPAELQSVRVIFEEDPDPDTSYLEQDEFEDRLDAYRNEIFHFVGVRIVAEVSIADTVQTLTSPGVWGIESDSEQEHLDEIISQEWAQLRVVLKTIGVTTTDLPLDVQREWIEWRT